MLQDTINKEMTCMNNIVKRELETLNFSAILTYDRPISLRFHSTGETPLNICKQFCRDCETKGLVPKSGSPGILMSHGCTSDEFSEIIGSPLPEVKCSLPIMFLLENPGADNGNGESQECVGVTKNPPINHFYFSSGLNHWPTEPPERGNPYGDYFAFLMARFGLSDVYITNCIKCKYDKVAYGKRAYDRTADNCMVRFLEKEISIFRPRIIFCFGKQVANELLWKRIERLDRLPDVPFRKYRLHHPASVPRCKKYSDFVHENNLIIGNALAELSITAEQ